MTFARLALTFSAPCARSCAGAIYVAVALATTMAACGGSDDSSDGGGGEGNGEGTPEGGGGESVEVPETWPELPSSVLTEAAQDTVTNIEGEAAGGCLSQAQAQTGGGTAVAAGKTSAGERTALWVVYESGAQRRAAVQLCSSEGDCACAVAEFGTTGATITPVTGELSAIGAPVLGKVLSAAGLDSPTRLAKKQGSLSIAPQGLDYARFAGKQRFVIANAYGPLFGTDLQPVVAAAQRGGRFTEAREHAYAQAEHLDAYLSDFHARDVLIWFAAAIQRGVGSAKPEGMSVNRGLFGDATYDRERIAAQLESAPLGGPGLLVLAGAESFGSAASGLPTGGVAHLVNASTVRPRAVVGFRGWVDARAAHRSVREFMLALSDGESLQTALVDANAELQRLGAEGRMESNLSASAAGNWYLPDAWSNIWSADAPGAGQFVANFLPGASTQCAPAGGGAPSNPPVVRVQFFTPVNFQGPFFSGTVSEPNRSFSVFGVVGDMRGGGAVQFVIQGSSDYIKDIVVLGDGRFCASGQCAGKVAPQSAFGSHGEQLYFGGTAVASPYTYSGGAADGHTCSVFDAKLTSAGDDPGWLTFSQP